MQLTSCQKEGKNVLKWFFAIFDHPRLIFPPTQVNWQEWVDGMRDAPHGKVIPYFSELFIWRRPNNGVEFHYHITRAGALAQHTQPDTKVNDDDEDILHDDGVKFFQPLLKPQVSFETSESFLYFQVWLMINSLKWHF